mgnify:CR=1 FL=1
MADPTSNIKKWVTLGWDDKSGAIIAMAKLITELGKTNPDYATFAPEWFPWYGATTNIAWGKMVDPDLLEPYVDAWIRFAFRNKRTFTAAQAKAAMVGAGLENTRSYVVSNAMWRLDRAGKLPDIIKAPAGLGRVGDAQSGVRGPGGRGSPEGCDGNCPLASLDRRRSRGLRRVALHRHRPQARADVRRCSMSRQNPRDDEMYELFHGKEPTGLEEVEWKDPDYLVELGDCLAVEYKTNKVNGAPADRVGRMTHYRHSMAGKGNRLFTNPEGTMLVILGPTLHIEDRGIVD